MAIIVRTEKLNKLMKLFNIIGENVIILLLLKYIDFI